MKEWFVLMFLLVPCFSSICLAVDGHRAYLYVERASRKALRRRKVAVYVLLT